jgi:hypothetical protein
MRHGRRLRRWVRLPERRVPEPGLRREPEMRLHSRLRLCLRLRESRGLRGGRLRLGERRGLLDRRLGRRGRVTGELAGRGRWLRGLLVCRRRTEPGLRHRR